MGIGKFHLPIVSGGQIDNNEPTPYVRPSDWLDIDSLVSLGEQKIVILAAVFEDANFVAVQCRGNYTVNWGDGTVVNTNTDVITYHQYNWSNPLLDGTLTTRGYKQAIITITPQAGQNLTLARLHIKHNQVGLVNNYSHPWLDIKISAPNITVFEVGAAPTTQAYPRMLEQFDWIGTNLLNGCNSMFANAVSLKKVKNLQTNTSVAFQNMFQNCFELEEVPFLNTSNGTQFVIMFQNCYKLKSVPLFDTSKGTNFANMFENCVSIIKFPNFNCILGTSFTNMFNGCRSMLRSPELNLSPTLTKNFTNMFSNCVSMIEFTNINTGNGSNYNVMFQNCHSLRVIPATINTTTTSNNVSFNGMFQNCYEIETAPNIDFSKGGLCSSIFASCWSISEFPAYNFSSATILTSAFSGCVSLKRLPVMTIGTGITSFNNCFSSCISLEEAPIWNLQNATDVTNMFNGCSSLRKVPTYNLSTVNTASASMFDGCRSLSKSSVTGMRYTHSYLNCKLSRTELVTIFNNLGTAVGAQTITITGNYGASTLTAGERAIATGKGWTISG